MTCQREQTAWHEAGHAVAYVVLGRRFRYVTIRPRTLGLAGQVAVHPAPVPIGVHALTAAAGPVAEERYLLAQGWHEDEASAAVILGGCGDDFNAIRRCYPGDIDAQARAERGASSLLDSVWPAVSAVAERLLSSRRTLGYSETATLVTTGLASPRVSGACPSYTSPQVRGPAADLITATPKLGTPKLSRP